MRSLVWIVLTFSVFVFTACAPIQTHSERGAEDQTPAEVNTQLGIGYMREGMYEAAMEKLQKALEQDPKLQLAHVSIAILYEQLGEEEKAEKHYVKAYRLNKSDPVMLNNYGQYLCRNERLQEADKLFLQALQDPLYRTPEVIYTNAGICAQKQPDLVKAERYFRLALEKRPTYQPALRQMARLSFEQENYLATRAYLQRLQEQSTLTPEFLWIGVRAEAALGAQNAVASYALALKNRYPDSEQTKALIEWERKQRER